MFLISAARSPRSTPATASRWDFAYVGLDGHERSRRSRRSAVGCPVRAARTTAATKVPVPPPSPHARRPARPRSTSTGTSRRRASPTARARTRSTSRLPAVPRRGRDTLGLIAHTTRATAPNDTLGYNTASRRCVSRRWSSGGVTYHHSTRSITCGNGFRYFVAVTAYDLGNSGNRVARERCRAERDHGPGPGRARTTARASRSSQPLPRGRAGDQGENVRDHYLWFANLPTQCQDPHLHAVGRPHLRVRLRRRHLR